MKISLASLKVVCKSSEEVVDFSPQVTFIHGPVSTGKSTTARLIDFCFGGELEQTPALRSEFVSVQLAATIGDYAVVLERHANQASSVRVTWELTDEHLGSVTAPLDQSSERIIDADVYNFSDLIFYLAGVEPIKVRKSKRDPESPLVRLSLRDLLWYCYLDQDHLDSSFYRMEDTFKRYKSMDVFRFVVGFYSEKLNELDQKIAAAQDKMRANRAAAEQIRSFLKRFNLGTEVDLDVTLQELAINVRDLKARRTQIENDHLQSTHAIEPLRQELRELVGSLGRSEAAIADVQERVAEQTSLRAELISAKVKSARVNSAEAILTGVAFQKCPQCGRPIAEHRHPSEACNLCGQSEVASAESLHQRASVLREDLNTRIEELDELLERHRDELEEMESGLAGLQAHKKQLDDRLVVELQKYDSAYVSEARQIDSSIAELEERQASLKRLAELPKALDAMEEESGKLQGQLVGLREAHAAEQRRLARANENVSAVEDAFREIMLDIGFPGLSQDDRVAIDKRTWQPRVFHGDEDEIGCVLARSSSGIAGAGFVRGPFHGLTQLAWNRRRG